MIPSPIKFVTIPVAVPPSEMSLAVKPSTISVKVTAMLNGALCESVGAVIVTLGFPRLICKARLLLCVFPFPAASLTLFSNTKTTTTFAELVGLMTAVYFLPLPVTVTFDTLKSDPVKPTTSSLKVTSKKYEPVTVTVE